MRRFRLRRRRAAALALLPLAALTSTTHAAAPTAERSAEIDASSRSVPIGKQVTLRGSFPGANKESVEIRFRPQGKSAWRVAGHTRTGAAGRYSVRVKPRRIGYWRAQLAGRPQPLSAAESALEPTATAASALDRDTAAKRISVRSRTTARVRGRNTTAGRTVRVHGQVTPAGAKRRVVVRIGKHEQVTKANRGGEYSVRWEAPSTGSYPVRVKARSNRIARGSADRAGKVTVFRPAAASWYGPGLYGNPLACGGTLGTGTIGVAHKTMPCGTKLTLRYGNKSVNVRVIDRGPFAGNREFDLTAATKQALGFPDVGTVLSSR